MKWTRPYYGVTHCGELADIRRATVTARKGFADLTKWGRGIPLTQVKTVQFDCLSAAKAAGERWIKEDV